MPGCLTDLEMRAWLAGDLPSEERAFVDEHLRVCEVCRDRAAALRRGGVETIASSSDNARPSEDLALEWSEGRTSTQAQPLTAELRIPGYARLQQIGRGGQGVVYSAWQVATKRRVALKLLPGSRRPSEAQRARFLREVEALAALRHPAIVTVYESGEVNHQLYYSMEYVRGVPVTEYVREQKLEPRAVLALFAEIAEAVGFAHERGIIHRDLKPSNILIDQSGRPHVLDFGLAKAAGIAPPSWDVTVTGEFVGTLAYAAPEQGRGGIVDARADVYALGVVLYEALCARRPFEPTGDLPFDIDRLFSSMTIPPSQTGARVDRDVDTILLCALNKEQGRRYASCREMAEDLRRYLDGRPVHARRDHYLYVLRKDAGRLAAKHPVVAMAAVLLASVAFGAVLLITGIPKVLDRWFERTASQWSAEAAGDGWTNDLAFLVIDDRTYDALPALADTLGVPEIRQNDLFSWRLLHAKVMEELATTPPRVLAYDIAFATPREEFDERFAESARKLRAAGCKVILGMFSIDPSGEPKVAPVLRQAVDACGWLWSAGPEGSARAAVLTIERPPYPLIPSLTILAYAGLQKPGYLPKLAWSWDQLRLDIGYQRIGDGDGPLWLPEVELTPMSFAEREAPKDSGLADGSDVRTACLWVSLPDRETLDAQTLSMLDFCRMGHAERATRVGGKVVLVGDTRVASRPRPDRFTVSSSTGDRVDFGVYVHGAAVNALLQGRPLIRASLMVELLSLTVCALLGAGAALVVGRRRGLWRWTLPLPLAAALGAAVGVAVVLFAEQVLSLTTLIAVVLVALVGSTFVLSAYGQSRSRRRPLSLDTGASL